MLKANNSSSRLYIFESAKSFHGMRVVILLVVVTSILLALTSCTQAPVDQAVVVETLPVEVSSDQALPAEVTVDQAHELYEQGVFFLDVRTQEEWDQFHAPDSILITLDQLEGRLNELPQDEPIVVVCRSGNRSQTGRDILLKNGFEDVTSMAGGLTAWQAAGYPVE